VDPDGISVDCVAGRVLLDTRAHIHGRCPPDLSALCGLLDHWPTDVKLYLTAALTLRRREPIRAGGTALWDRHEHLVALGVDRPDAVIRRCAPDRASRPRRPLRAGRRPRGDRRDARARDRLAGVYRDRWRPLVATERRDGTTVSAPPCSPSGGSSSAGRKP
jgi:hypothetical protein